MNEFDNVFHILMNVQTKLTIVAKTQTAPTLLVHITASVSGDTTGAEINAQVPMSGFDKYCIKPVEKPPSL
jgi:hypothetical protein